MHQAQVTPIVCVRGGAARRIEDSVAIERPLEIRVRIGAERTGADDDDAHARRGRRLAAGFLHAEGVVRAPASCWHRGSAATTPWWSSWQRARRLPRRQRAPLRHQRRLRCVWADQPGRHGAGATAAGRTIGRRAVAAAVIHRAARRAARGAGDLRPHRRPARRGAVHDGGRAAAACARTSAATTRSTRWSGALLLAGRLPLAGTRAAGQRAGPASRWCRRRWWRRHPVVAAVGAPSTPRGRAGRGAPA